MELVFKICNAVFLLVFAIFDVFNRRIIPNYLTIPYVILSLVTLFFRDNMFVYILGFAEFCLILVVVWVYSKVKGIAVSSAIGGADLKVFLGLSINSGVFIFNLSILISSLLGIVFALITKTREIPFLPFLFVGYVLAIIYPFFGKMVLTFL